MPLGWTRRIRVVPGCRWGVRARGWRRPSRGPTSAGTWARWWTSGRGGRRAGRRGLAQAIEGADFGGYVDPVVDDAPWMEETAPESAEFLGVFGLEEEGGSAGVVERTPVELAAGGSNIGVERFNHRELTYQVVLVARSEAGLSYGLMWLSSVLRGPAGGQGCWGDQACVFAWCPSGEVEGDRAQRVLYDAGLLEAPTVSDRFKSGTGVWFAEVEFTLVSGNPHLYALPYISLGRSEEHTSELQSRGHLVCRHLLEKKNKQKTYV